MTKFYKLKVTLIKEGSADRDVIFHQPVYINEDSAKGGILIVRQHEDHEAVGAFSGQFFAVYLDQEADPNKNI